MTQRLNRIVTVSGASAETEERPIPWRFNFQDGVGISGTASTSLPSLGRYAFSRSYLGTWHYDDIHDTDALLSETIVNIELAAQSVNPDGSADEVLPRIETALSESALAGKWIRFRPERLDSDNYVEWACSGRADYFASQDKFQHFFFADVSSPTLSGAAFSWERDESIIITVEDQITPIATSATADKKTWALLQELGIQASIVAVGSSEYQTASEETARLVIRYDPAIAQGKTVVDDLGRTWQVRGSRALKQRRWLEFDLYRVRA